MKQILLINDLAGYGKVATAAMLPVLSYMGLPVYNLPTALVSNTLDYGKFNILETTDYMEGVFPVWKELGFSFDAIATGFICSERQARMVADYCREQSDAGTIIFVDPIMGDNGKRYRNLPDGVCQALRHLVSLAHIITPNLTEACLLTGTDFHDGAWKRQELDQLLDRLHDLGPAQIVITGIPQGKFVANMIRTKDGRHTLLRQQHVGCAYSGTGDIFVSILAADAVSGVELIRSVRRASLFIKKCILLSAELGIPGTDGVCFEEVLGTLQKV